MVLVHLMVMVILVVLVEVVDHLVVVHLQKAVDLHLNHLKTQVNHIQPIMEMLVVLEVIKVVAAVDLAVLVVRVQDLHLGAQLVLVVLHNHFLHLLGHFSQVCHPLGKLR